MQLQRSPILAALLALLGCYYQVPFDEDSSSSSSSSSSSGSTSTTWVGTVTTEAPPGAAEALPCNNDGVCDGDESGISCVDCAVCGNGEPEAGEECDGGEGCEPTCRWTPAAACSGSHPSADELAALVPECLGALDYASALSCLLEAPPATGCDAALWASFLAVFQLCDGSPPVCWQAWTSWPQWTALWTCEGC